MAKIKPKNNNNTTAKILVLAVVVVLLISVAVFTKNSLKPKKVHKEIKWKEYSGQTIPTDYEIIKQDSYETYSYNLETNEDKNSFSMSLPSAVEIESMSANTVRYTLDNTEIVVTKTTFADKKEELQRVSKEYTDLYDKIQVKDTTYDKNIFAIMIEYGKYNHDKSTISFNQEVRIYVKAEDTNEYALIILNTREKRLDEEVISKIINSITINDKEIQFCNGSKCEANLAKLHNKLKENVKIKVNKNKYVHQNDLGLSMYNAKFVTKEFHTEKNEDEAADKFTGIDVNILYGEEYSILLKDMEETKINGKKIYSKTHTRNVDELKFYEGTYIYELSKNLYITINISSRLDNLDDVIKDFINFELK